MIRINVFRYFVSISMMLIIMIFVSCDSETMLNESIDPTGGEKPHTAKMHFEGGINDFDASRGTITSDWNEGDKLYIRFKSGSNTVLGTATYNAASKDWTVSYTGTLTEGSCELFFFGNATHSEQSVTLSTTSSVYHSQTGAYNFVDDTIRLSATLSPMTSRLRFKGTPGTLFCCYGFRTYTKFDIATGTLTDALTAFDEDAETTYSVADDGYSPYIYGFYSDGAEKSLSLDDMSNSFSFSAILGESAMTIGTSGYLNIPTNLSHKGWELKPNQSYNSILITANGVTFKMKLVEAGTFTMGATSEQTGADSDESPAHQVTLTKNYYMGETEVTQALWYAVMGQKPTSDSYYQWYDERGLGDNYPAYYISWNDCQEFITKLNQLTGLTFRLPTEAEWEYAARGGNKATTQTLYSGSDEINDVAWYTSNSSSGTHEVAGKAPNALGLYDMSGNVWEWCYDGLRTYSSAVQTDPTGATGDELSNRALRGGSWDSSTTGCRVADRHLGAVNFRYSVVGMRLALSIYNGISSNTIDFSTLGLENATAVTDITMNDGTVLTFGSGTNTSNAPTYYTLSAGVRMYANNTLNVKASKTIIGVQLICDSYNDTNYVGNDTLNGVSGSTTVNPSVSGTTVTFSGFSGHELLITNAYSMEHGGVQLRVKSLTVYYAE